MTGRKPRLPLDDGLVESRLCTVAERGEGLVAEVPETVLSSTCCKRSDEDAEEAGESAGSGRATEQRGVREVTDRGWTSEHEGSEASD